MKKIVSVRVLRPGSPCASLPIPFPKEYPLFLYFGILIRWRYSSSLPASFSKTDPAKSAKNCSGYDLYADFFSIGQLPKTSTELNRLCCFNALVLLAGGLSSLLIITIDLLFVVALFDG